MERKTTSYASNERIERPQASKKEPAKPTHSSINYRDFI